MKTNKLWGWIALFATLAFVLQFSTLAKAQDQDSNDDSNDPPGRVGRLDYSQGSVSFRPAGEDDWVSGVPNRPLVTGDLKYPSCSAPYVSSAAARSRFLARCGCNDPGYSVPTTPG